MDGTCEKCPDYEIVTPDSMNCYRRDCGIRDFLRVDGECETCPDFCVAYGKEGKDSCKVATCPLN